MLRDSGSDKFELDTNGVVASSEPLCLIDLKHIFCYRLKI